MGVPLRESDFPELVGKVIVTASGPAVIEAVDLTVWRARGRLADDRVMVIDIETVLDDEIIEVDWSDPAFVEKYLAGEQLVDAQRETPPPATSGPCDCDCGHFGGCYSLQQDGVRIGGHFVNSAHGCICALGCWCVKEMAQQ
jgi:hypothetical protein